MAIQSRRGAYGDFDPNKMLPGEWASVLKDDPKAQDGKSVYMCFAAGDVKRMATYEDMKDNIKEATGDVVQEVTEEYAGEIKAATKAANDAASAAESATDAANTATGSANTAASSATAAAKAANDAAKNVKNDFYGAYADFPETGEENKMYIDTSSNPNKIYTWDSASASYKLVSGGSEENPTYDVTLTLPVSGWVGDFAPYAQTVASAGMTADKSLVFTMISAGPVPTDAEYESYGKLTGVAQGVNNVTFYCNEKPTTELKIRAFCGAGSDEGTDLSIIGEGFNANKSYAIGDYCVNESSLWEFTAAKGAGAWDSSKVTQRSVIGLIQSLQSRVSTLETQVSSLNANLPRIYDIAYNTVTSVYNQDFKITSVALAPGYKYLLLSSGTISISSSTVMMYQFSITSGKATINASTARTTGSYGGGCVNFAEVETNSGECTVSVIGYGIDSTPHTQSALLLAIKMQAI